MRILGIDPSLSSCGITILNEKSEILDSTSIPTSPDLIKMLSYDSGFYEYLDIPLPEIIDESTFKLKVQKKYLNEDELLMLKIPQELRMRYIVEKITSISAQHYCEFAGIEGIAFGAAGRVIDLAKLLGRIQQRLDDLEIPYIEFPPTEVKKFAGKGNFSKEQMASALDTEILKRLTDLSHKKKSGEPIGLEDQIDSYWIAKMVTQGLQTDFS